MVTSTKTMTMGTGSSLNYGLVTIEEAKAVAKYLFDQYDKNQNGVIDLNEVPPMMMDTYKAFNKSFNPTTADIESYSKILDRNNDGKITLADVEDLALKYLVGERFEFKSEKPKKAYNPEVEQRLDVARRIFKKFDADGSGFIEENEVPALLTETYANIGVNYKPTSEDVRVWISMGDQNSDGKISLPEYEAVVIRSLAKLGIKID